MLASSQCGSCFVIFYQANWFCAGASRMAGVIATVMMMMMMIMIMIMTTTKIVQRSMIDQTDTEQPALNCLFIKSIAIDKRAAAAASHGAI